MNDPAPRDGPARPSDRLVDIVADQELLRLAGIDIDRYLALSDFEQRLVLKLAEQLVDAGRRADPGAITPDSKNSP